MAGMEKMTHCDVIQDLIPLYYDAVASEGSRAMVEAHIKQCAACREMLESMKDGYKAALQVDTMDINILKTIKRRIVKKIVLVTMAAVVCTVVLLWVMFTWYIPTPFDADAISVYTLSPDNLPYTTSSAYNAPLLVIRNNYYSVTYMQIADTLFLKCKNTLYTRFFRQGGSGHWFSVGDPASIAMTFSGTSDDSRHQYAIGDDINRIYYMQADYNKFFEPATNGVSAADAESALEKAKQDAILVWQR